jgi:mannose-6-phosphate isomerase-like protein (cupin superfamily)
VHEHTDLPAPVDRASASHYIWGDGCDGWYLVRTDALSVIAERMPPGTAEQRHRHRRAEQFFYVLAGELTIEREGEIVALSPGSGLSIPAGTVHEVRNQGAAAAEFLVISQPPSHGDRESVPAGSAKNLPE